MEGCDCLLPASRNLSTQPPTSSKFRTCPTVQADARIKEAQAAILEAQANYEGVRTDSLIAALEHQKLMWEQEIREETAKVDESVAYYKAQMAIWEAKYQEALKSIELAKLALTAEQWEKLSHYTTAIADAKADLDWYQSQYESALDDYTTALRGYDDDQADLQYRTFLARKVRIDSIEAVVAKKALTLAEENAAKDIEATAWDEELAKLEEQMAALNKENADLQVLKAKFEASHIEEKKSLQEKIDSIQSLNAEVEYTDEEGNLVTLNGTNPAMTLETSAYEYTTKTATFGDFDIKIDIVEDEYFYQDYVNGMEQIAAGETTLADLGGMQNIKPFDKLNIIDREIFGVKLLTLNENGQEWKKNDIARLEEEIGKASTGTTAATGLTLNFETAKKEWEQVVKAYNHLKAITSPTELPQGKTLNEKIAAYNTAAAAYKAVSDDLKAKDAALLAAIQEVDENATINSYDYVLGTVESSIVTTTNEVNAAKETYDEKTAYLAGLIAGNITSGAQYDAAKQANDEAKAAYEKVLGELNTLEAQKTALTTAKTNYDAAVLAVAPKQEPARKAYEAVIEAYEAYVQYISQIPDYYFNYHWDVLGTEEAVRKGADLVTALVAADVLEVSQDKMRNLLQEKSRTVWGYAWIKLENGAWLIEPTEEDVIANIKEEYARNNGGKELEDYKVQFYYGGGYGSFGSLLDKKAEKARAEAYLNGGKAEIEKIVADIEAIGDKLQAEIDGQQAMVEDLIARFLEEQAEYNEAYQTEVGDLFAENEIEKNQLTPVINALKGAIDGFLAANQLDGLGGGTYTAQSIQDYKDQLERLRFDCEKRLIEAEEDLAISRDKLEKFVKEGTDGQSTKYYALQDAQTDLERAEAKLAAAQEEYDQASAELEAILKQLSASSAEE